jgi:hypothetical protein
MMPTVRFWVPQRQFWRRGIGRFTDLQLRNFLGRELAREGTFALIEEHVDELTGQEELERQAHAVFLEDSRWAFPSSACSPPLLLALPCRCGLASEDLASRATVRALCRQEGREDPRYSTVSERSSDHEAVGLSPPRSRFYGHTQHTRGINEDRNLPALVLGNGCWRSLARPARAASGRR